MSEAAILPTAAKRKSSVLNRFLWGAVIILFFFAVLELVFAIFIAPNLTIKYLDVRCDFPLSENEILAIAGIERKEYYFSIKCGEIQSRLAIHPQVRQAHVEKIFPDTLKIILKKRNPLALSFGSDGQKTVPVAFDREGVIFQIDESITNWHLPVVSGLKFTPRMGLRLPKRLHLLLEQLETLKQKSPELFNLISEIKIISVNEIDYELILFPIGYRVSINLGDSLDDTILKYALMVLDVITQQGVATRVRGLDFRTGEVVYKLIEEE